MVMDLSSTLALGIVSAVLGSACSSAACPSLHACDIRRSSCQRETAQVTQCLRGGATPAPQVTVVDANAFIAAQARMAEEQAESKAEQDSRRGLALLRLMPTATQPGDLARESWKDVAAFFSGDTGGVTILDSDKRLDTPAAVTILLHEFVHAMQHTDTAPNDELFPSTEDGQLALAAMKEGEAILYQDRATAVGYGFDPDDFDWNEVYTNFRASQWNVARHTELPYLLSTSQFSYAFGGAYLATAWRKSGDDAIRRALATPALSSREVLAGYGAAHDAGPWLDVPTAVGHPRLPDDFELVHTSTLGAWLFEVFRDKWREGREWSDYVDSGLSGDVLSTFRQDNSDITVVWRLRFDTQVQASAIGEELRANTPFQVIVLERDVALLASGSESIAPNLLEGVTWEPVPEAPVEADDQSALVSARCVIRML